MSLVYFVYYFDSYLSSAAIDYDIDQGWPTFSTSGPKGGPKMFKGPKF